MTTYQLRWLLLLCTGLFALSGASCPQLLAAVHQSAAARACRLRPRWSRSSRWSTETTRRSNRSRRTRRRSAGGAFPRLRASVAFQRPRRFRLRADTGLTGTELDLGSNDDLFWFWVRREQPPAMYLLPPRPVRRQPGAADDAVRAGVADRGAGRGGVRSGAAAPRSVSVAQRPAADRHHPQHAGRAGDQDHDRRRLAGLDPGAAHLSTPAAGCWPVRWPASIAATR